MSPVDVRITHNALLPACHTSSQWRHLGKHGPRTTLSVLEGRSSVHLTSLPTVVRVGTYFWFLSISPSALSAGSQLWSTTTPRSLWWGVRMLFLQMIDNAIKLGYYQKQSSGGLGYSVVVDGFPHSHKALSLVLRTTKIKQERRSAGR